MSAPRQGASPDVGRVLPDATRALLALGERMAGRLGFDALSICVLDDSQEKLLVLPLTGDEERRGALRKILTLGRPPFQRGLEEVVLERTEGEIEADAEAEGRDARPSGRTPSSRAASGEVFDPLDDAADAISEDQEPLEAADERDRATDIWRWLWDPPVCHGLIVPVRVFGREIATLNFGRRGAGFSAEETVVARALAGEIAAELAGIAIYEKMRLSEHTARHSYQQLIEFSRVGNLIVQEKDLDRICNLFMQALREHSVFRRGILTLLDEDLKGYKWFFFGMSDEEIEYFHSHAANKMSREQRAKIFQERYRVGNSYYIPASSHWDYTGVRSRCVEEQMLDWHPDDFLFIPLYGSHKRMVGIVSVDDPADGRAPSAEALSSFELFANQVAHAIEEKKLDQEVKKSTRRYKTLIDTMNDGLVVMDFAERITMVNPTLSRLVGYRLEEMIGSSLLTFITDKSRELVMGKRDERRLGIKSRYEIDLLSKDGTTIPVLMSGAPLYESNRLVGSFAVISDLREQKKSEAEFREMHDEIVDAHGKLQDSMEQLQQAQEQLVQAEKLSAVGELVSGVAHELNNPLTGVLGYAQLLMGKDLPDDIKRQTSTIYKEAARCQKIVQNLLTFARKHKPERSYVDVNEIIEATVELRSYQLRVDNVELSTDLGEGLPKTMADYHQLQQVFINIINNAHQAMVEHAGRGEMVVRTFVESGKIVVTFTDDGPGVPEDKLGKIFDPFFTTKEVGKGTGLGLSLSYGIVKEHGGEISAGERPDGQVGAEFRVNLPIWAGQAETEPEHPVRLARIPSSGHSVLVVDDEPTVLELLTDLLSSRGHQVEGAGEGQTALELIQDGPERFDVIISDMKMPLMDGRALYEAVHQERPDVASRIVFATGDTVSADVRSFLDATGNHYISKPFQLDEVDRVIETILGRDGADDDQTEETEKAP